MADPALKVAIAGAGSVGCYVGGMLQAVGHEVVFIGRPSMAQRLADGGLSVQSMTARRGHVEPGKLTFVTRSDAVKGASYVLVCVKSMATDEIAGAFQEHLHEDAIIVSLQNGLDNTDVLKAVLPGHKVLAGMVAFNVVQQDGNHFIAATEGGIHLERDDATNSLCNALNESGIDCQFHDDMQAVQWSKLLLNLNNALNALSGRPLAEQLRNRSWRRVLAACIREGLAVAKAQGVTPVRIGKVKPQIVPLVLSLPDFLFERVASQMLRVDPQARSSMADDLVSRRKPEIDYLNGALVKRGHEAGVATPVNEKVCRAVDRLFRGDISAPVLPADL